MTVSTTITRNRYPANGIADTFAYAFGITAASEIEVSVIDADGVQTVKTLDVDYTVTGVGDEAGGDVEFVTPPADGSDVLLRLNVPYTQPTDLKNQGSFYPRTHERMFDRATRQLQQLKTLVDRAVVLPDAVDGVSTILPVPVAGGIWGWNDDADEPRYYTPEEIATVAAYAQKIYDTFTASSGQTTFTLSADPGTLGNLDVSIDGVVQVPGTDFTFTSNPARLVLNTPAAGGEVVLVRFDEALPAGVDLAAHLAASDPHPQYLTAAEGNAAYAPASHTHALSDLEQSGASIGQVPVWNGSQWIADDVVGGGGGGATNLSVTISASQVQVNSDTGTDAIIPGATGTDAGVMTAADKTKLDGIASGAEVNPTSTDAVPEGATNLYHTTARARAAAVADSITDGVNNVAPSQNAVFDALAAKAPLASPALTGTPTVNGIEVGYRKVPLTTQNGAYTLVAGDAGKGLEHNDTTARSYTVDGSVFAAGDVVTVLNNTGTGAVTIVQGTGMTLYLAGTATTGNRTVAVRGMATIFFASPTVAYVSGPGVS